MGKTADIMALRYLFTSEIEARKAINECNNLGYWAYSVTGGYPQGVKMIIECTEQAEGLIETRYSEFLK